MTFISDAWFLSLDGCLVSLESVLYFYRPINMGLLGHRTAPSHIETIDLQTPEGQWKGEQGVDTREIVCIYVILTVFCLEYVSTIVNGLKITLWLDCYNFH